MNLFKLFQNLMAGKRAVAQANAQEEFKSVDGLGQRVARISRDEFLLARINYGDNCWNDPDFVRAYLRDNPDCRVKTTRGTRGQELPKRPMPPSLPQGTLFVPPQYAANT